jgi:hypothetical protein
MEFVYSHNNQTSTIPEFDPSKDAIDFQNTRASFDSIHIAADPNDGHAVIYANHNVVNVMGVAPDQLNSSNVLFNIATH